MFILGIAYLAFSMLLLAGMSVFFVSRVVFKRSHEDLFGLMFDNICADIILFSLAIDLIMRGLNLMRAAVIAG